MRRLVAQHHAAVLRRELHQPRGENHAVPVARPLLAHGTADGADDALARGDPERWLQALQRERAAQLQRHKKRAVRLVLVRLVGLVVGCGDGGRGVGGWKGGAESMIGKLDEEVIRI